VCVDCGQPGGDGKDQR